MSDLKCQGVIALFPHIVLLYALAEERIFELHILLPRDFDNFSSSSGSDWIPGPILRVPQPSLNSFNGPAHTLARLRCLRHARTA